MLQEELGERFKVATIAPTGERGVLFATIMNEKNRAAGRGGMGAVIRMSYVVKQVSPTASCRLM